MDGYDKSVANERITHIKQQLSKSAHLRLHSQIAELFTHCDATQQHIPGTQLSPCMQHINAYAYMCVCVS